MLLLFVFFVLWLLLLFSNITVNNVSFSVLGSLFRDMCFNVVVDLLSASCLLMLFCCGVLALIYCVHYMGVGLDCGKLFSMMCLFLFIMVLLIVSGDFLLTLVFWEYLGLVSFFLILFYGNMGSLRASLITLYASRFGDVSLFFIISWVFWWNDLSLHSLSLFLLFVVLTKSACYPFVSWLLEAMRAPTPVSSLVHSSTLVAAGAWFLLRYNNYFSSGSLTVLYVLCLTTILLSGVSALFFSDLKKLVALSTCNNISWCLVFFICGGVDLAILQLVSHGVAKCYLFMTVGDLMSSSGSSQNSVGVYLSRYGGCLSVCIQSLLVSGLCGFPFLGVFFSKHLLFSYSCYSGGVGVMFFIYLGLFFSFAYSTRLLFLLVQGEGGIVLGYSSSFVFIVFLCLLSSIINYAGAEWLPESVGLSCYTSVFILFLQLFGCLLGWLLFIFASQNTLLWNSSLIFSDIVVDGFYKMYVPLGLFSLFSQFRWELWLIDLLPRGVLRFLSLRGSVFSFNMTVLGVWFVAFFSWMFLL